MRPLLFLLLLVLSTRIGAAAPFQNLSLDLADTSQVVLDPGPFTRGLGTREDLLPGWQLSKGGTPLSTLGLNLDLLSFGAATLISAEQSAYFGFPVEGSFALYLAGSLGNADPFSLTQTGDIPAGAQWFSYQYAGDAFAVSVNGQNLQPINQTATSQIFDISAFAGETVDLSLTMTGPIMPTEAGHSFLDSLVIAVPEPSSLILLALGGAFLVRQSARFSKPARPFSTS